MMKLILCHKSNVKVTQTGVTYKKGTYMVGDITINSDTLEIKNDLDTYTVKGYDVKGGITYTYDHSWDIKPDDTPLEKSIDMSAKGFYLNIHDHFEHNIFDDGVSFEYDEDSEGIDLEDMCYQRIYPDGYDSGFIHHWYDKPGDGEDSGMMYTFKEDIYYYNHDLKVKVYMSEDNYYINELNLGCVDLIGVTNNTLYYTRGRIFCYASWDDGKVSIDNTITIDGNHMSFKMAKGSCVFILNYTIYIHSVIDRDKISSIPLIERGGLERQKVATVDKYILLYGGKSVKVLNHSLEEVVSIPYTDGHKYSILIRLDESVMVCSYFGNYFFLYL